jgi:hypothetical protein
MSLPKYTNILWQLGPAHYNCNNFYSKMLEKISNRQVYHSPFKPILQAWTGATLMGAAMGRRHRRAPSEAAATMGGCRGRRVGNNCSSCLQSQRKNGWSLAGRRKGESSLVNFNSFQLKSSFIKVQCLKPNCHRILMCLWQRYPFLVS